MSTKSWSTMLGVAVTLAVAQSAWAHPGHGAAGGWHAGFYHPLSGLDHILAMVAVGICAAQLGGRWIWLLPTTFLSFMIAGGVIAIGGAHVPMVEQGIAASVFVLGLLVAAGSKLPRLLIMSLAAVFAIFHGYAHGSEMQTGLAPSSYALGFVLATGLLHAVGVGTGIVLQRKTWPAMARLTGGAIAVCGLLLLVM